MIRYSTITSNDVSHEDLLAEDKHSVSNTIISDRNIIAVHTGMKFDPVSLLNVIAGCTGRFYLFFFNHVYDERI
jgi:hypothetical protein